MASKSKMSDNTARVLECLGTGPATTKELAKALGLDIKTVSNSIHSLRAAFRVVEKDLVDRRVLIGRALRVKKVWRYAATTADAPRAPLTKLRPTTEVIPSKSKARAPVAPPRVVAAPAPKRLPRGKLKGLLRGTMSSGARETLEIYAAGIRFAA